MADTVGEPSFDGNAWAYLGWRILGWLVTGLTLGLAYPLAACWLYGYEINHTTVEGRRLKFSGSAGALFGHYIIWWLLSIITLTLYAWIGMPVALLRWKAKNTSFAN
jgi:uncharacterized membrane protein YjgN (DUF898 family)